MPRPDAGLLTIELAEASPVALHRQLADGLRARMADGRLGPGQRLPSTRALAADLGVARGTVVAAYDQLQAEGYLAARTGAGTFVADALPEAFFLRARPAAPPTDAAEAEPPVVSARARAVAQAAAPYDIPGPVRPLRPCLAPLDRFPTEAWARRTAATVRELPTEALGYGDPQGYGPLREALAGYLGAARGVRCTADQIVVTGGSQQALRLVAQVLLDAGDRAWVESPGYGGVRAALADVGAEAVAVPVDDEGLVVAEGVRRAPGARLAVVAPAHQFPLGVTLSHARRAALLDWAETRGGWIVEDDYDGEYRYDGPPLATLHALDPRRVLYVGTVSKVLAPALRIGYVVAPPGLVGPLVRAKAAADGHGPTLAQATLAGFIADGSFGRHLRRMRRAAASHRDVLVDALREGGLDVTPPVAGLHLHLPLPPTPPADLVVERAAAKGVTVVAAQGERGAGLALGFAAFRAGQIRWAVRQLLDVLGA